MKANETKFQEVIEGTKQYVIPLFQRPYSWEKKEWNILWKDIIELCELEQPRTHFIGSIVNMPSTSVPEGVAKFLLIDGQQRLTTIFIILILLRDRALDSGKQEFADEIYDTLLVNKYQKDDDRFKLLPTQDDRDTYKKYSEHEPVEENGSQLSAAYLFFSKKLKQISFDHERIKKIITSYFSVVSIVLEEGDNPYLVFESLNAKGKPLAQADLIRNYFFMRIHKDLQGKIYDDLWHPMQSSLGENLTEFIRHFLMGKGSMVKQSDVYFELKDRVGSSDIETYLQELKKNAVYYQRLIHPTEFEPASELKKYFERLNRIEVTTAYPLLLPLYAEYDQGKLSETDFVEILKTLENFLIRRFVCGIPTHQLNKIFLPLYSQIIKNDVGIVITLKTVLQTKGYPKDAEFLSRLRETRLYGAGERAAKTKLILESLEESDEHKEMVPVEDLSIEHIMPQTPTEWWKSHLGENWEDTHEIMLHTIGNLTLTAYNSELSNDNFPSKKTQYHNSHLSLNRYFETKTTWQQKDIEERADYLGDLALRIWTYFGDDSSRATEETHLTSSKPTTLNILGQSFTVATWRDVLEKTMNTIIDLEPEKFDIIAQNFPRYLGRDKSKFKDTRLLANEYYIEVNLSSSSIRRFCLNALETVELTSDDWKVTLA